MITPAEQEILDRIREREGDIYAEVLVLVFMRLPHAPTTAHLAWPRTIVLDDPQHLADTVVGAFQDLNDKAREP